MNMAGATFTRMGQAIENAMAGLSQSFFDLEMRTAEAATILGNAGGGFDAVAEDIAKVSDAMNHAVTQAELGAAAYDVYSVGILGAEDRLLALELAAKASIAGLTDTATAVRAGAGAMNAFGMEASDLERIFDIQFNTVERGVITYEQLANVAGRVNAEASLAGQSLEVSSAALAAITKAGIPAQQAAFRLSAAFRSITKTSDEDRQALSALGVQILDTEGNYNSMTKIIRQLNNATEGLSDSQKTQILSLIAQDSRAISGIATLQKMEDEFLSLAATIDEAGSTQEKYGIITETNAFQLKQMNNEIEDNRASIGEGLTPATLWATQVQLDFYNVIADINPELVKYGGGMLLVTGNVLSTVGPIMQMVSSMILLNHVTNINILATIKSTAARIAHTVATGAATVAQWAFNVAMWANPVGLIILATIAYIGALIWLEKRFGIVTKALKAYFQIWIEVFNLFKKMYDFGRDAADAFKDGLIDGLKAAAGPLDDAVGFVSGFFGGSLPERGPLKNIVQMGEDLPKYYAQGIGQYDGDGMFDAMSNFAPPSAVPSITTGGNTTTSTKHTTNNYYMVDAPDFMEVIERRFTVDAQISKKANASF